MKKPLPRAIIVSVLSIWIFVLCGTLASKQPITETKLPVIVGPTEPPSLGTEKTKLLLEKDLTIGSNVVNQDDYLGLVDALQVDNDGNIYILSRQTQVVKIFNKNGGFLRNIGGKKSSYKGFQNLIGLGVSPEYGILIFARNNLYSFTVEGKLVRETEAPQGINDPCLDSLGNMVVYSDVRNLA